MFPNSTQKSGHFGIHDYSYLPNKRGASNKRGAWKIYQNLIKGDGLLKGEGGFFSFQI